MSDPDGVLDDILGPGLRLVICGTAAGTRSAALKHYYSGQGNRFWDTLKDTGLIPDDFDPCQEEKLPERGIAIGLTDLAKMVSGGDKPLPPGCWNVAGFKEKLREHQPRVVAFNGKKAAKVCFHVKTVEYGEQPRSPEFPDIVFFVATSTSRQASGPWKANPGAWRALADLVNATRDLPRE